MTIAGFVRVFLISLLSCLLAFLLRIPPTCMGKVLGSAAVHLCLRGFVCVTFSA